MVLNEHKEQVFNWGEDKVNDWIAIPNVRPMDQRVSSGSSMIGGDHYIQTAIQPWDIIEDHSLDFWEGNAIKYILRRKNNRLEDLKKAKHYIEHCIEMEQDRVGDGNVA